MGAIPVLPRGDVSVRIYPAGCHRHATQVVVVALTPLLDAGNAAVHDVNVFVEEYRADTVEQYRGPENDLFRPKRGERQTTKRYERKEAYCRAGNPVHGRPLSRGRSADQRARSPIQSRPFVSTVHPPSWHSLHSPRNILASWWSPCSCHLSHDNGPIAKAPPLGSPKVPP